MTVNQSFSKGSYGLPAGSWRWVALGFFFLALIGAGVVLGAPQASPWAGPLFLAGIGVLALFLLYAVWPRNSLATEDARRIAEAAAQATVAWVVTGEDGAVLDCNESYRQMARTPEGEAPPPPELALHGDASAGALYRLTRAAAAGQSREEAFSVRPGLELAAAVGPIAGRRAAWWFAPRMARDGRGAESGASQLPSTNIFRDAPIGIAFVTADAKLSEANAEFAEFFDKKGPLEGISLLELVDPGDRAAVADVIQRGLAGGTIPANAEVRPADRSERMAALHVSALPDAPAERAILYLVDVSEQKALETKFAQSQKLQAVGQLAGGVAHDFNNLLTVIIGNCEFLLMRHQAGDPSFKEIHEIHQNALRAATLVGQLLAFSRKQTLQPKVLNPRDVVGELALMLRRLLREGVELKLEHGADLWTINADETQISNAIINLVVNARDAMPRGGAVTISTANESVGQAAVVGTAIMPPGDYVRITVSDTGIGIPKEHLEKIFDPFFTTKPVGQGTGLGLATVYGIIKQTGGFITVDSEVGKGTAFRIYLPRYKSDGTVQPIEPERVAPRDITGQDTVLLVEDEEAVRSFAARALKLRGYNVIEAPGGEEALDIVRNSTSPIHLLITDVVMPNMDGPTLARAVKRLRPDIAIIFMSGYAEEAFRRNDEKAEDLHFLPKPFGLKQLAAKVKDVLSGAPAPRRTGSG